MIIITQEWLFIGVVMFVMVNNNISYPLLCPHRSDYEYYTQSQLVTTIGGYILWIRYLIKVHSSNREMMDTGWIWIISKSSVIGWEIAQGGWLFATATMKSSLSSVDPKFCPRGLWWIEFTSQKWICYSSPYQWVYLIQGIVVGIWIRVPWHCRPCDSLG